MLRFQLRSQRGVMQDLPVSGLVLLPEMRRLLCFISRLISSPKLSAGFLFSLLHAALLWSGRGMHALVRIKNSAAKYLFFFQRKAAGEKEETTKLAFFSMFPHPNPSPGGRGDKSCRRAGRRVHLNAIPDGRRCNEFYGALAARDG